MSQFPCSLLIILNWPKTNGELGFRDKQGLGMAGKSVWRHTGRKWGMGGAKSLPFLLAKADAKGDQGHHRRQSQGMTVLDISGVVLVMEREEECREIGVSAADEAPGRPQGYRLCGWCLANDLFAPEKHRGCCRLQGCNHVGSYERCHCRQSQGMSLQWGRSDLFVAFPSVTLSTAYLWWRQWGPT